MHFREVIAHESGLVHLDMPQRHGGWPLPTSPHPVLLGSPSEHSAYPERLAIVYFALGSDAKAMETLRRHFPEADAQRAEKNLR
jgi:hypothetical protein